MNAMPAYVGFSDVAGLKWAGGNLGERKKRGIPYCSSLILLVNPHINNFIAVLDGALITNMRTGAQTAVALKYLLGLKDGERRPIHLGIYGAGMQGHMQTRAISTLFDIEELRIYDVSRAALERFREDMQSAIPGRIILCDDPKDAAQGDAVICVTQSKDGFLKEEWLSPRRLCSPWARIRSARTTSCSTRIRSLSTMWSRRSTAARCQSWPRRGRSRARASPAPSASSSPGAPSCTASPVSASCACRSARARWTSAARASCTSARSSRSGASSSTSA